MCDYFKRINEQFAGWTVVSVLSGDGYYGHEFNLRRGFKKKTIYVNPRDCGLQLSETSQ